MSFNGSGLFQINSTGQPVVAGTNITASVFNALTADLATGLSTCIAKDGQTTVTADIPLGNNKITGLKAATARTDAASIATIQDGTGVYVGTVGGTADVITLTPSPAITAYTAGQTFRFLASGANTTNVTVNISALGAKAITKNGTTALVAGDIPANTMVEITYDGTRFILMGTIPGIGVNLIDAKGDLIVGTAADTAGRLAVGSDGTIPMARSAATTGLAYVAALTKAIYGLTYAVNGSDAANDIDFAAGGAMDTTGAYWLTGSALTKQIDNTWAVGTNAGMLDTGVTGNNDYYLWIIGRSDTGVVDYLASLSSTAPTMPANYDYKRLIGWVTRTAGANVNFTVQELSGGGIQMDWVSPGNDVDLANTLTTTRRTDAIKVPKNFSVLAKIRVDITDASSPSTNLVTCPDETDVAPSASPTLLFTSIVAAGAPGRHTEMLVRTSSTGTIAARSSLATCDTYRVSTIWFQWARRN